MTDKALPTDAHCIGCQGWTEPEYLRREKCPGLNLDAARVAAPSDGLREDAGHLADAAVHMADHIASLDIYCEDTSNVRHFAEKVRAARAAATPTEDRS
jgi:hypothetical protein